MDTVPAPTLSKDSYQKVFTIYSRLNNRDEIFVKWFCGHVHLLTDVAIEIPNDTELKVLSVGSGDGRVESRIWSCLRDNVGHSKISATMVEPDARNIQHFQDLVAKNPRNLQGIQFDLRCQTFQDYENSHEASGDKFHIITCFSSLYYLGDLEMAVKNLHGRLENGGILLLMVAEEGSGWGKMIRYLRTKLDSGTLGYCSDLEVQDVCKNLTIPVSQVYTMKTYLDVSACLQPPDEMSEDGRALLDFITYREDFVRRAAPDLRDDVLRFLGSECSERGPAGDVVMDQSAALVVICREG